jgi:hypothetical protein
MAAEKLAALLPRMPSSPLNTRLLPLQPKRGVLEIWQVLRCWIEEAMTPSWAAQARMTEGMENVRAWQGWDV